MHNRGFYMIRQSMFTCRRLFYSLHRGRLKTSMISEIEKQFVGGNVLVAWACFFVISCLYSCYMTVNAIQFELFITRIYLF